jgi:protein-export membrane protein SecD
MAKNQSYFRPILTLVLAALVVLVALPPEYRQWLPGFRNLSLHYGLDLAGGTQLDFRISEREIEDQIARMEAELKTLQDTGATPEAIANMRAQVQSITAQRANIVEAIRTVLERRINSLGVSEATITPSYIGDEKHLLVECPGVVDTQVCIDTVGKTIQLEFKEEFHDVTTEYEAEVRARVSSVEQTMTASGLSLATMGQDLSDQLGIAYSESAQYFHDELPEGLVDLWNAKPTDGVRRVDGSVETMAQAADGSLTPQVIPGIYLAEVVSPRTQTGRTITSPSHAFEVIAERDGQATYSFEDNVPLIAGTIDADVVAALSSMSLGEVQGVKLDDGRSVLLYLQNKVEGEEVMNGSHILIAYEGALSAAEGVTRTKAEAEALANQIASRLDSGEDFVSLARTYSDGPSGDDGGTLGSFGRGDMVPAFEAVAFDLESGEVSDPVETQFGYHIIRADSAPASQPDTATFDQLILSGEDAATRGEGYLTQIKNGQVQSREDAVVIRSIFFSLMPTGWKDTSLDGKHFRSATVSLDPVSNLPVVQITFDDEGAKLFQELTKKNIGRRIAIFVGGQLVSAPTVQTEIIGGIAVITGSSNIIEARTLAQDLNTGAIPAPIYLTGQRTVEATLGAEAMRDSVKAALIGTVVLMLFMVLVYRMLGLIADFALVVYAVLFIALLKFPLFLFSSQNVVLTLAGLAGMILSIGMAVDANVLVFERTKEELRKGKTLRTALETGFIRAWPSIRDGNASTIITCIILFLIGTSIVRGFAITLGMGLVISMFTAVIVTRWMLQIVAKTPIANIEWLFPGMPKEKDKTGN